eukprot:CAMPEP_0172634610 /NCGR_PEP_ID=MMETSP1068-20121228/195466_1 /TAXON_ID=35684 /ORGANISM="Pseudopedinella elastica, Strain CCMP716" /LENGTH=487 /DNA_ID=CAMNT_0013446585 /DNA_START=623 /DNA_END=2086 /DNA_ORIENTATION=-
MDQPVDKAKSEPDGSNGASAPQLEPSTKTVCRPTIPRSTTPPPRPARPNGQEGSAELIFELRVGDSVEVRDQNEPWSRGVVVGIVASDDTNLDANLNGHLSREKRLLVRRDGMEEAFTWDEWRIARIPRVRQAKPIAPMPKQPELAGAGEAGDKLKEPTNHSDEHGGVAAPEKVVTANGADVSGVGGQRDESIEGKKPAEPKAAGAKVTGSSTAQKDPTSHSEHKKDSGPQKGVTFSAGGLEDGVGNCAEGAGAAQVKEAENTKKKNKETIVFHDTFSISIPTEVCARYLLNSARLLDQMFPDKKVDKLKRDLDPASKDAPKVEDVDMPSGAAAILCRAPAGYTLIRPHIPQPKVDLAASTTPSNGAPSATARVGFTTYYVPPSSKLAALPAPELCARAEANSLVTVNWDYLLREVPGTAVPSGTTPFTEVTATCTSNLWSTPSKIALRNRLKVGVNNQWRRGGPRWEEAWKRENFGGEQEKKGKSL